MSRLAPSHLERRAEFREPVNVPCRVMHGPALAMWADCTLRDLSASGAKLEISHFCRLPPRFVLLHFQAETAFEVVLKWRRGDLAGVSFEARHALGDITDARLTPVRDAWVALQSGFARPT